MAGLTHQRKQNMETYKTQNKNKKKKRPQKNDKPPQPPPWSAVVKGLFFGSKTPQKQKQQQVLVEDQNGKKCKKMRCSGSLCSNTKVMQKPETTPPPKGPSSLACSSTNNEASSSSTSSRSMKAPLQELNGGSGTGVVSSSTNSSSLSLSASSISVTSFRGMPFRRFSGCYECRMVIDPVLGMAKDPSLRTTICTCPQCGEIFMKPENLELHQAVKHAVSELGPEDTSKNIVEIIFQSSWLKKQTPICRIDRILKVQNTPKTISKFEEYRDSIKSKATKLPKKHPRCIADGNELLRFHCTTLSCSLGLNGSSNLCNSIPNCNVCSIIKNGFKVGSNGKGILTTATSGKAHDQADGIKDGVDEKRAMLVCRVIAGRVQKSTEGTNLEDYDSVGGDVGVYSNLDELYVFNPKAILPCFVVIYTGF